MDRLFDVDWAHLFVPTTPIIELFLRGSVTYLALFILLRFVLNRVAGTLGLSDLLMVVLIADAAQNAMADDYSSITDGLFLVATIVFWNHALNWIGYHFPYLQRFFHPPPLLLVKDGRILGQNMRRELMTREELMSQLREQGVNDLNEVKEVYMEGDGRLSVITREAEQGRDPERNVS